MVKNLPAIGETWVPSLGWEAPLEEGMATHFNILAWRIPMDKGAWWAIAHGVAKSQTHLSYRDVPCSVYIYTNYFTAGSLHEMFFFKLASVINLADFG